MVIGVGVNRFLKVDHGSKGQTQALRDCDIDDPNPSLDIQGGLTYCNALERTTEQEIKETCQFLLNRVRRSAPSEA